MTTTTNLQLKGSNQGGNQGSNQQPMVATLVNSSIDKQLQGNPVWLSVKEGCQLLSISPQAVKKNCKKGLYQTIKVTGNGGQQYRIALSSLPVQAQIKYHEQHLPKHPDTPSEPDTDWDMKLYMEAPEYNRRLADKYLLVLQESEGMIGKELRLWITNVWNRNNPDFQTSYPRVIDARKGYKREGISALLGGYGKNRNRALAIEDLDEIGTKAYRYFAGLYLNDSTRSVAACWLCAKGYALDMMTRINPSNIDEFAKTFPHETTFLRAIEKEYGESYIHLQRYGYESWNRTFAPYIERDDSDVKAGEAWVSDHHQLDEMWIASQEGLTQLDRDAIAAIARMKTSLDESQQRPWFTCWRDYKTGFILSWTLSFDAPNADRVLDTLATAIERHGRPLEIIIDNGKDYRAYDVAGGRTKKKIHVEERKVRSIVSVLGIKARFVWPYHGQSKPIERDFRDFTTFKAKFTEGYTGRNTVERPESLKVQTKRKALLNFVEGFRALDAFIETVIHRYSSRGKNLRGRSRLQAWTDEFVGLERVQPDVLALLRMRTSKTVCIRRNGISYKGTHWWADWMERFKSTEDGLAFRVYLRLPFDASREDAWVFSVDTDEFLGRARANIWVAPGVANTADDKAVLSETIQLKKQVEKSAKASSQSGVEIDLQEARTYMAVAVQHGRQIESGNLLHLTDPAAIGRALIRDVVDQETGEVWEAGTELTETVIEAMLESGLSTVRVEKPSTTITRMTKYDEAARLDEELRKTGTYGVTPQPQQSKQAELIRFPSQKK